MMKRVAVCTALAVGLAFGQTVRAPQVSSTYPIQLTTVGGVSFYTVALSVTYATGLAAGSYLSQAQLNTDFKSLVAAYANQQDLPEAILASALSGLMAKYSQLTGGTVTAVLAADFAAGGSLLGGASGGQIVVSTPSVIGAYVIGVPSEKK